MISIQPLWLDGYSVIGIEVQLPKTTLIAVSTKTGYLMCGALDVNGLNEKLSERKIIAGRALGVRTLQDLLEAKLDTVTTEAHRLGIVPGMKGKDALVKMLALENSSSS